MFYGIVDDTVEQDFKKEGIDYDHINVRNNLPVCQLYEEALRYEPDKTFISSTGAMATLSGKKKGRSPKDKRVVDEDSTRDEVWWGPVNTKLSKKAFDINHERAVDYLNTRERLYVVDGFAGWDPKYRLKIRIVCARPYHALFMRNMLIRPSKEELEHFGEPDFTILNAGQFPANRFTEGMSSDTSISLSFEQRKMVILGTEYAGEMKKGVFTVMHYFMPKAGVLSLHSSLNVGQDPSDVTLFFGLSGTGKTTLSADPKRFLIGDDEHCWTDQGTFNIEGGCYAKAINLSAEKEPDIYNAIRFGTVLENVVFDPFNREVDYDSGVITENTRASYPIEFIPNAKVPCVAGHPKNIVFLTCDAFGVLPPISKLTSSQAMYHFISGYTAKVAGTEEGITEPEATFSACFGQPFLVFHPVKYATMLAEKMQQHKVNVWLVNTGWNGGKYGVGSRISLKYSRALIDAIHSGELEKAEFVTSPVFNLAVPTSCTGVPAEILDPAKSWKAESGDYLESLKKLGTLFINNFKTFEDQATAEILASAPQV
ncbi:Phosphoenolpyruvate carboxykinase [ATP] [Zancudomyces culisetae]|uniref:Phosphoenolpyruvate carboxykinase (ATP) n=1 Tax=Zancudomyces culisetae TaxID=1213189 RepID=A0A1R1PRA9_ZANCU|nr:Phosphoenolpyruvate carboxykinase [ATP] [Zancudomyces culisetae]|eukprot:OMH83510.1 Phosphoenolpyruvate carboxykinase [ATP] [Zancudomyces culisetae]